MLRAVEGVFRNGHVELREMPKDIQEARVVVTFLEPTTRAEEVAEPPAQREPDLAGAGVPPAAPATSDERLRAFRALLASLPEAPAVPLAAMDRENLYP